MAKKRAPTPAKKAAKKSGSKVPVKKVPKKKPAKKIIKKVASKRAAIKKKTAAHVKSKVPKKVAKKAASGLKGYNEDQYEKFQAEKKRLSDFNNMKLKEILKANMQSMSGNKEDLILKIADGIVLGRIPRCPKCYGGRPKFDFKAGTYYCSGYRDDVDFKNCHTTF